MKKIRDSLFILMLVVNCVVFAQGSQTRDGSSLDKAFLIKEELLQVINREDYQLRRLFRPKRIRWKVIARTIKSFGVLNCGNIRRGETKVIHLVDVELITLGEKGTIYFDITNSYLKVCADCPDSVMPEQNMIANEMIY
jgi:hypothetical protein